MRERKFASYYPADQKRVVYKEGVFLGYRNFDRSQVAPLYPFGYGLSYTKFAYSDLKISPRIGGLDSPVIVSFDVKNAGEREGAETAEVYVGDQHASVPRPIKELKDFAKVSLKPGETHHITLSLDRRAFCFYDMKRKDWSAEPGEFSILVGTSSADISLQGKFTLTK
jgi:beta-glucosidase